MSMNDATRRAILAAIAELEALALAQTERLPDHADRIHAAFLEGGEEGVRIEMEKILGEQRQGLADATAQLINQALNTNKRQDHD